MSVDSVFCMLRELEMKVGEKNPHFELWNGVLIPRLVMHASYYSSSV